MADDSKDDEATIKVASKKSSSGAKPKTTAVFKLKEKFPKVKEPGDYERGHVVEDPKKAKANAAATRDRASSPGDAVNKLDDLPLETFEKGIPLVDIPALFSCKWCKKSSLMTTAVEHINACLKVKKEKANRKKAAREARERAKEQALREERERRAEEEGVVLGADGDSPDEDEDEKVPGGKTTKKAAGKKAGGDGDAKGKKRKADGEPAEKAPSKKKKKEEQKPKAKPKGPVDVERQCGVLLPNGQPCARSLTCKSHSMGAKRAVAGRSLPYDMLLAAYQKKNQARQQKAALDANAPIEEDEDPNAGPVDSDEEYNAVMSALKKWNPQPAVPQPQLNFLKREVQIQRLRHCLDAATDHGRKNIFQVRGYGAQRLPPGHPGHRPPVPIMPAMDQDDAPGEEDTPMSMGGGGGGGVAMPGSARSATFAPIPQRQLSVGGPA